jgi:hypothetical protein
MQSIIVPHSLPGGFDEKVSGVRCQKISVAASETLYDIQM